MPTELSGVEELLMEIDSKKLFGDYEWKVVDNTERETSATKYLDDPVTRALKEDKTVEVNGFVKADRYQRWARANGLKLHVRHPHDKVTFIWVEKPEEKTDESDKEKSGSN